MWISNNQRGSFGAGREEVQELGKSSARINIEKLGFGRKAVNVKTDALFSETPRAGHSGDDDNSSPDHISWVQRHSKLVADTGRHWYKQYVCHMLLRQGEIPRSNDGRLIELNMSRTTPLIDERTGKHYINNTIRSSRYTIWTFFPLQLWFQFTKIANFYFLIMGILQLIPGLSTTGTYTTILPLLFFLSFSIAREGYDDFRRYRLDRVENRRLARVLRGTGSAITVGKTIHPLENIAREFWVQLKRISKRYSTRIDVEALPVTLDTELCSRAKESSTTVSSPNADDSVRGSWATVKWIDLKVGEVIEIKRDEQIPADIVLLYADGRDGIAYIETMALDGETSHKSRRPPDELAKICGTLTGLEHCRAHFAVEDPNLDLYEFHGKVSVNDSTLPLTLENVIFRGSVMRNTKTAFGMIVNTGEECKIRMNANKKPQTKAPAIQYMTNRVVILLTVFVILLSIGCTAGYEIWTPVFEKRAWYLAGAHLPLEDIFIAFAIEFNNLIPLALYVSLEIIKFGQFILLQDIEMYDPISDTPVVCNTQTIFENLGQVSYIFSDKTGTLTENVMKFRKVEIAGIAWQHKDSKNLTGDGNEVVENGLPAIQLNDAPVSDLSTDDLLQYMQLYPSSPFTAKAQIFLLALALCHTCFPEVQANGDIAFQATSPDETALVEAAQDLGYLLVDRSTHSSTLLIKSLGSDSEVREQYEILDVIEFSSKRKRMSIIVKFPDGRICLLCKGADSMVLPRLKVDEKQREASDAERRKRKSVDEMRDAKTRRSMQEDSMNSLERLSIGMGRPDLSRLSSDLGFRLSVGFDRAQETLQTATKYWREKSEPSSDPTLNVRRVIEEAQSLDSTDVLERTRQQIDEFACEGLRTLVYGHRFIDEAEYASWHKVYQQATTSLNNRQEMIEAAGELIEQNLELAGATAIEDKLQKGVPETIDKLQRANIKIWMLTGDKRETAINIAHSARICKPYSQVVILDQANGHLEQKLASILVSASTNDHTVIVIDGQTLVSVEKDAILAKKFYELLLLVDAVICCRASPSQKASIVKNIRRKLPKSITLAIGDGGNDIAMIQEAHVGIGISGKEGLQAARVADYSIAQFRFLQRLLLVHGHWNYARTAKYILLTFWKEMLFYAVQIMYQRWNGYTGTSLYESDSLTVWNILFTSLPVMLPGIFEQDLSAETLLAVPELYGYGQQNKGFDMWKYTWWMLMAALESQLIWWMTYSLFGVVPITDDQSLFAIGNLAFSVCVIFINVKLLILQFHHKTWIPLVGAAITISGWWAWNFFLSAIYHNNPGSYTVYHAFTQQFGRNPTWWAVFVLICLVMFVCEVVVEVFGRWWGKDLVAVWQELEQDKGVRRRLREEGGEGGYGVGVEMR
ncbi:phospholipid-translocating P-type ATPase [Stipitochalara longipes BDJ]|nr:phospholipid-translocating P-type ATPase [Stipitochalara longipes BDJ]